MIDLQQNSGLPIDLQENNKLLLSEEMHQVQPDIRTQEQMLTVLSEPQAAAPQEFYYMYRECCLKKHIDFYQKHNLRYDITVLPAFTVGNEFNKTLGHFHPKKPGTETTYPEVYEVLHGTAHYLLQKDNDFILIETKAGQKAVMPPSYAHITVNPSKETLVMANITERNFKSEYGKLKQNHGAMYYETTQGFVENSNYEKIPPLRKLNPRTLPEFGLTEKPMYLECISQPEKFSWLKNPENHLAVFEKIIGK